MTPRLAAAGLACGHVPGQPVLTCVDLAVPSGAVTAVVGPNGAGKSTLLATLAGRLAPTSGAVTLDGRPLDSYPARERAARLAVLPQTAFHTGLSVRDLVALGRYAHLDGRSHWPWQPLGRAHRQAVTAALATAGVTALANRPYAQLSGGEQQLVRLAMALAQEAPVLLLDEPTAHLDPHHAVDLLTRLRDLAHRSDLAVLVVLHDLVAAGLFADQVVVLGEGRLLAAGPPSAVLVPQLLTRVYGIDLVVVRHPVSGRPVVLPAAAPAPADHP